MFFSNTKSSHIKFDSLIVDLSSSTCEFIAETSFFFYFCPMYFFFLEIWTFSFDMIRLFAMKTHNKWIIFFYFFRFFRFVLCWFFLKFDGFIETEFFFSIFYVWFFIFTEFICKLIELNKKINDIIFFCFHVVLQTRSQRQQVFFDWKQILIICQNYFYWKF